MSSKQISGPASSVVTRIKSAQTPVGRVLGHLGSMTTLLISPDSEFPAPDETLEAVLISLASCDTQGRKPVFKMYWTHPDGMPSVAELTGVENWEPLPGKLVEAAEIVASTYYAAPLDKLNWLFGRMKFLTGGKDKAVTEAAMKMEWDYWKDELLRYPGDIVCHVLMKRRKWWPSWDEVEADILELMKPREALVRHLRELDRIAQEPPKTPEQVVKETEEEEKERLKRIDAAVQSYHEAVLDHAQRTGYPPQALRKRYVTDKMAKAEAEAVMEAWKTKPLDPLPKLSEHFWSQSKNVEYRKYLEEEARRKKGEPGEPAVPEEPGVPPEPEPDQGVPGEPGVPGVPGEPPPPE